MNHVCLVSDQAMPNFLPILDKELKPDSVTLVVSTKMRDRAEWLKKEIAKHRVEILPDIDVGESAADIHSIEERVMEWADKNKELMSQSTLNVTGGTKPMAIAAQKVFQIEGRPVFYVDIATDEVTWLDRDHEKHTLTQQPNLSQFFGLNGITATGDFRSVVPNDKWRNFADVVAGDMRYWGQSLANLNCIASQSYSNYEKAHGRRQEDQALQFQYGNEELQTPHWNDLVELLHADELVTGGFGSEKFKSSQAARFCAGIWLEHFVFLTLKEKLRFDKKHSMMNVEIRDSRGNRNELDSVVLCHNTLFVIEDKTRNMKSNSLTNVADNAIYKLANIASKMGLRARGILVSARSVRKEDRERAKANRIDVIDRLPNLESDLRRIFGMQ